MAIDIEKIASLFGLSVQEAESAVASRHGRLLSALAQHRLFVGLPQEKLAGLFPACMVEDYKDEEILCSCPAELGHHDAFLVLDGKVAIKFRRGDAEHVMELAGFGSVFNVGGLVGVQAEDLGARALGPAVLLMMDAEKLQALFEADPTVGYAVVRNLTGLVMAMYRRYLDRYLD